VRQAAVGRSPPGCSGDRVTDHGDNAAAPGDL
jgi:hypothetical protein